MIGHHSSGLLIIIREPDPVPILAPSERIAGPGRSEDGGEARERQLVEEWGVEVCSVRREFGKALVEIRQVRDGLLQAFAPYSAPSKVLCRRQQNVDEVKQLKVRRCGVLSHEEGAIASIGGSLEAEKAKEVKKNE